MQNDNGDIVIRNQHDEPPTTAAACVMTGATPNGEDNYPPSYPDKSTRACSRKNRVYIFRDFLLQTYGSLLWRHASSSVANADLATTILDVAGGKGDLSWLMLNVDGIRSVIVDPRPTQHGHLLRSVEYLRRHPAEAAERAIANRPTHQPLAALLTKLTCYEKLLTPRHMRILVDDDLVDAVRTVRFESTESRRAARWSEYWERAAKKALRSPSSSHGEAMCTEGEGMDAALAIETILSVRLIVGFHPDQATEACMDLAVLLNIPFCVVPCCVFPSEFPYRSLSDGTRVRKYDEFLTYLRDKFGSHLRQAILPFHETKTARNIVLYRLPTEDERG